MNGDQLAFARSYDGPPDERYFAELARLGVQTHPVAVAPTSRGRLGATERATGQAASITDAALDGVILECAADVRPAAVAWAWAGRVPLGSLTLLVGAPGLGKTMLACELAARASRGRLDGDLGGPANVLYLSAEDSPAHTLVPRLMAARADLGGIAFLHIRDDAGERGLALPDDTDRLRAAIGWTGARLVVVDPVMAHLATALDVHRDHSIRRALAPLARLADELGVAVLGVAHLNKATGSDLFARVGGSIGLTAAARSVLVMGADPEAEEGGPERIVAHGKSNLSPLAPALRLRVEGRSVETPAGPITTAGIVWAGQAPGIFAADLLASGDTEAAEGASPRAEAETFLRELLADGPVAARDVRRAAREALIADRTLDRAKAKLHIIARHEGRPGEAGRWELALRPKDATDPPRTPPSQVGALRTDVAFFGDRDDRQPAPPGGDDPQADTWVSAPLGEPDSDAEEETWMA